MHTRASAYLLVLLIPALMPAAALAGAQFGYANGWAWLPIIALFIALPALDYLVGKTTDNPDVERSLALENQVGFRILNLLCLPVYLGLLVYSGWIFAHAELNWFGKLGWVISQGVVGGVMAINAAHELIHKPSRLESTAGGILLSSVCYGGFKVEHVRGHHVHVSTPLDASSARYGQNVYAFVLNSIPRNIRAAFALEAIRLTKLGLSPVHWRNEVIGWYGLSLLMLIGFGWWLGSLGVVFFIAQSVGAFVSLEIINYVEHYGLERALRADGRYERTTHLHSWNSSYLLTNLMLFQLQRHSDHHENPRRRYQALRHYEASPQLPGGYPAMFLLALIPPLWFRVINPIANRHRQRFAGERLT